MKDKNTADAQVQTYTIDEVKKIIGRTYKMISKLSSYSNNKNLIPLEILKKEKEFNHASKEKWFELVEKDILKEDFELIFESLKNEIYSVVITTMSDSVSYFLP